MPTPTPGTTQLEDGTYEGSSLEIVFGVLILIGSAAAAWVFRDGITTDVDDPNFNPITFLLPVAVAYALYSIAQGLRKRSGASRWGVSTLEFPSKGPRMGKPFTAKIICPRVTQTTGDLTVTLKFVETFLFERRGRATPHIEENIRWETALTLSSSDQLSSGVPVSFELPAKQALQRNVAAQSLTKGAIAIGIPGLNKTVLAHNRAPDSVRWLLEISAPTSQGTYSAAWGIPVNEEFTLRTGV